MNKKIKDPVEKKIKNVYYSKFQSIFDEFGIKSSGSNAELELLEILESESHSLPCCLCGKERDFEDLRFQEGDPYCKFGCDL